MNLYLSVGLFALYAGLVSLAGLMTEREAPTVIAAKRYWGRKRGLTLHFLANIALPLVFGIVFLSRGVTGLGSGEPSWGLTVTPLIPVSQDAAVPTSGDQVICGDLAAQRLPQMGRASHSLHDLTTNPLLRGFP